MSIVIKSKLKASNSANLKYAVRDNLLKLFATDSSDVTGVQLFSLDDVKSYESQSVPTDAEFLKNLANGQDQLQYKIYGATGSVAWDNTKKAIDFSSLSKGINGVQTSAGWLANEFNGNAKRFILTAYVYIPHPADWHAKSGGLVDFAGTITSPNTAVQTEILGALAFIHHPSAAATQEYQIWARFSDGANASGTHTTLSLVFGATDADIPFGEFAQVSLVRTATENTLYLISSKGVKRVLNTTALSGKDVTSAGGILTWGRGGADASTLTNKYKLSRGFIINLNKNPIEDIQSFLKADWDRQVARGWIA